MGTLSQTFMWLPTAKDERKEFIQTCVDEFLSGNINPLAAEIAIKNLEDIIKAIRSDNDVKSYVIDEATKHGKKFDFAGAEVAVSSRTNYDYAACNDPVYNELKAEIDRLTKILKAREEVLKTGIDPATGEVLNKPKESVTEFLTIRFK
jgi:hypothetical protein